jgi:hypothetical protein
MFMLFGFSLDLEGRLFSVLLGLVVGTTVTWLFARWRRSKDRRRILQGDARDTVLIEQHLFERGLDSDGRTVPTKMRVRYLGHKILSEVVPNTHLASELKKRAQEVTDSTPLISMEGATGSFMLETLCGFVCDRLGNEPFEHDLFAMTPCRESAGLAYHHPISVLLVSIRDFELLQRWEEVEKIEVEHTTDGVRLLTLFALAQKWKEEQEMIRTRRASGQSVRYLETIFILDLALDQRSAPIPTRPVPWERFGPVVKATLEARNPAPISPTAERVVS